MNWNQDKSLKLTRICILVFTVLLAGMCVAAPWLYERFIKLREPFLEGKLCWLLATNYGVAIPVAAALYQMHRLLANISREKVFVADNTRCLRILSWCCLAAGVIFGVSSLYYLPFAVLCVAAIFMALVLRVIKNVFAQAEKIKEENDYTI